LGTELYHSISGRALPQGGSAQLKYRFALAAADRAKGVLGHESSK
jgi:hypothetical protein